MNQFKIFCTGSETNNFVPKVKLNYNIYIVWSLLYVGLSTKITQTRQKITGIVLTQKSCIFTQKNAKKCSIKILMRPRTQDVDLKISLHLL